MKLSDLNEKCVIFKLIRQRNTIKGLSLPITIKPVSIFELIKIVESSGGVIYGNSGYVYHDPFPIKEIFGHKRLFLFGNHTPFAELKFSFVVAKNIQDARRLFIKWADINVDYEVEVIFDISLSTYISFKLIYENEIMMGKPLPYDFISQTVPISCLNIHIINHGIIDDTEYYHCSIPRILDMFDSDKYKDKDVFIITVTDVRTGCEYTTCVITDNIEDTVGDLVKCGSFISRCWRINIVDVMRRHNHE